MSQTAIQTSPNPDPGFDLPPTPRDERRTVWQWVQFVLKPIASLRLTVVLFALSMFLVFCGTLAQVEMGLWTAMDSYFRSALVWVPYQLFVQFGQVFFGIPKTFHIGGSFPFPGGWLLGGLLLANLLAAHLVRFKLTWKRSGILLIHSGIVIMMLSELVTGLFAVEARMTIAEGETVNFVDVSRDVELALTDPSDPKVDDVVVVPGSLLKKGGLIRNDDLPVDVEVLEYMENSVLVFEDKARDLDGPTFTSRVGVTFKLLPRSEESGAGSDKADFPSVRVRFLKKGTDESLGEHVLSLWFYPNATNRLPVYRFAPQHVKAGGKTYTAELRPRRIYKPYAIHLIDFTHDKYIGTDKPKNYASLIRLSDGSRGESRETKISMNAPLRHEGETFYQSGFLPDNKGTVLQVVRNPGWLMPYLSCAIVSLGMLIHFGLHLVGFLRKRAAS